MSPVRPRWLTELPIAHRGLHDCDRPEPGTGPRVENSVSAARAAIASGFAIECDVQLTGDGEAVVFHDFTLERLTGASGRLDAARTSDLTATVLRSGPDRITTLPDFLAMIGGRTPLICEIKSRFDGDPRLAERVARCAATYAGPMCIESFDPRIMAHLRRNRTVLNIAHVPLGMVAQASYDDPRDEWAHLDPGEKHALAQFLHFADTRPDFLSFGVRDLPHAVPTLCRMGLDMPVTSWTVRTPQQRRLAERHADQIVFEGDVFA